MINTIKKSNCYSRAERRNRADIDLGIKSSGGFFDLFDNVIKSTYRITDDEYDYLAEHLTDDEITLFTSQTLTFSQKRQCLLMMENHLINFVASK